MKKRLSLVLVGALASTAAAQSNVYVYSTPRSAMLFQWTEANGQLTGFVQLALIDTVRSPKLTASSSPFTGTRQGSSINFLFRTGLFSLVSGGVLNGSLSAKGLLLNIPSEIGGFGKINLTKTTFVAYEKQVAQLRTIAAREAAQQLAAQQKQRAREAALIAQQERAAEQERARAFAALAQQDRAEALRALEYRMSSAREALAAVSAAQSRTTQTPTTYRAPLLRMRDQLDRMRNALGDQKASCESLWATYENVRSTMLNELAPQVGGGDTALANAQLELDEVISNAQSADQALTEILAEVQRASASVKTAVDPKLVQQVNTLKTSLKSAVSKAQASKTTLAKLPQPGTRAEADAVYDQLQALPIEERCPLE